MNGAYPLLDEKKYRCCCFHVERGATIIAVAGIVLQLFVLYPYSQWGRPFSWLHLFTALVSALFYASILLAQYKRQPRLYLPFLILNGIGILVLVVYSLILLMVLILGGGPDDEEGYGEIMVGEKSEEREQDTTSPQLSTAQKHWHTSSGPHSMHIRREILHLLVMLWASAVVSTFFQWVVYRAWKWMKLECGGSGAAPGGPLATTYTTYNNPNDPIGSNGHSAENAAVMVSTPGGGIVNVGFIDPNASRRKPAQRSGEKDAERNV